MIAVFWLVNMWTLPLTEGRGFRSAGSHSRGLQNTAININGDQGTPLKPTSPPATQPSATQPPATPPAATPTQAPATQAIVPETAPSPPATTPAVSPDTPSPTPTADLPAAVPSPSDTSDTSERSSPSGRATSDPTNDDDGDKEVDENNSDSSSLSIILALVGSIIVTMGLLFFVQFLKNKPQDDSKSYQPELGSNNDFLLITSTTTSTLENISNPRSSFYEDVDKTATFYLETPPAVENTFQSDFSILSPLESGELQSIIFTDSSLDLPETPQ